MELTDKFATLFWPNINTVLASNFKKENMTGEFADYNVLQLYPMMWLIIFLTLRYYQFDEQQLANYLMCYNISWEKVVDMFGLDNIAKLRKVGGDTIGQEVMVYSETIETWPKENIAELLKLPNLQVICEIPQITYEN
jgi:hypothetical protein